jgi:hypothetical protein
LNLLARPEGFEPPTLGFVVNASELHNLLNLLEAIDIIKLLFGKLFPVLADFGTFLTVFHTQIHTPAK